MEESPLDTPLTPEMAEAARKALETMLEGKNCIHCGAAIEHKEQVGRSVVAYPCQHRQYQGKVDLWKICKAPVCGCDHPCEDYLENQAEYFPTE